ncbi:MAG: DUF3526 domain-containing protein [Sphingopyxis sp.]|uniref:ABC transporter permease n=1 Tax=Sphingopyxis sp. TaxID=1908224 RepID=UPI002AB8B0B8|nr:DUF3526 domain-containing protein [Sphingopyxis sp.]MDZ3832809.1 DUF3526 domain-containing protein [Sphingopyxis sp.]
MSSWAQEIRLLLRSRLAPAALILLALLAALALGAGLSEVSRQRDQIAAIPAAQAQDIGPVAEWIDAAGQDPGRAAYYSFHPTWDAPSSLAFAALGMRDVSPFILRVRALGLEAQIYDGDIINPELALPGRFDFAFVLVFLAPLFVIILFHDLLSSEREAGRLRMLEALPGGRRALWLRRACLRFGLLFVALAIPLCIAAGVEGVAALPLLAVLGLVAAYLLFWIFLSWLIGRMRWSSTANAASLAAIWILWVLVLPTLAHVAINRAVPVGEGTEIAVAQREAVNRAWDIPRDETMRQFYASHPHWAHSPPLPDGFHYKWYFAFHQVGDESVARQVAAYRGGLDRRAELAERLGWLMPSVGVQLLLTRMADTDLAAQLAYQDRVRAYHRTLREFYYGYLFRDRPFAKADFARAPRFPE